MPDTIVSRAEVGRAKWDEFVDACPEAWLWHRYDFQDAFSRWPRREDASVALLAADGSVRGVIPAQVVRHGPLRRIDSLGGPALTSMPDDDTDELVRIAASTLRDLRKRHHGLTVDVTLPALAPGYVREPGRASLRARHYGLTLEPAATWMIDLRVGEATLWSRLHRTAKSDIRRAQRAGVEVRVAGPEHLDAYYALHERTASRSELEPHPRSYFEDIWRLFVATELAIVLIAEHDGAAVAGANFALYKGAACYWTGASVDAARAIGANHLLQWSAITTLAESGTEWLESGEASLDTRSGKHHSISEFKRKFGGELHPVARGRITGRVGRRLARWRSGNRV